MCDRFAIHKYQKHRHTCLKGVWGVNAFKGLAPHVLEI